MKNCSFFYQHFINHPQTVPWNYRLFAAPHTTAPTSLNECENATEIKSQPSGRKLLMENRT